jgi:amino acid permease
VSLHHPNGQCSFAHISRLVVIPLSFLRRLDSLKYTSVIALISIGYLVILVVYHFAKGDTMEDRGPIRVIQWGGLVTALQSFPVIVFAYTCHQNVRKNHLFVIAMLI